MTKCMPLFWVEPWLDTLDTLSTHTRHRRHRRHWCQPTPPRHPLDTVDTADTQARHRGCSDVVNGVNSVRTLDTPTPSTPSTLSRHRRHRRHLDTPGLKHFSLPRARRSGCSAVLPLHMPSHQRGWPASTVARLLCAPRVCAAKRPKPRCAAILAAMRMDG